MLYEVITYKLVAAAEKPHCGNAPNIPPSNGPNFPAFSIVCLLLSFNLCSIYSISKKTKNKNGNRITSYNVCYTKLLRFHTSLLLF